MDALGNSRSQICAVMVADVVGYSAMMEANPQDAVRLVRNLRSEHVVPMVETLGGEVLKHMGDGWIAAFPGAQAPVDAAMQLLAGIAGKPNLRLRIGANVGELVRDAEDF